MPWCRIRWRMNLGCQALSLAWEEEGEGEGEGVLRCRNVRSNESYSDRQ